MHVVTLGAGEVGSRMSVYPATFSGSEWLESNAEEAEVLGRWE